MTSPATVTAVVDVLNRHGVKALLMGGQACVAYGASEFTRDIDIAVLADPANVDALRAAVGELGAHVIAVPPLDIRHLQAGHAVHFRCQAPLAAGVRLDVMSRLRGVESFPSLWARRRVLSNGLQLLALPDLVAAKKTQREKDWPMIRRLVEADYFARADSTDDATVRFWLQECRTPELLRTLAARFPRVAEDLARPAVRAIATGECDGAVLQCLRDEEDQERAADQAYWLPLRKELEALRMGRRAAAD